MARRGKDARVVFLDLLDDESRRLEAALALTGHEYFVDAGRR